MSIQLIARDLYRLIREVEELEERIKHSPIEKREKMKDELRKLKADRNRMRQVLEGRKDQG